MIRYELLGEGSLVALVTLDRPHRRNALDLASWISLTETVATAHLQSVRAMVITGAGQAFCAGADLDDVTDPSLHTAVDDAYAAVKKAAFPIIAAVNGPAVGAGMQLAVTCDLRVAGPDARFGIPAAKISMPVDPVVIRRICNITGGGAARAILLGLDSLDADRAFALGLVDRLGTVDIATQWAGDIAAAAPLAVDYFKRMFAAIDDEPTSSTYATERAALFATSDFTEALSARAEHRPPRYTGA